MNYVFNRFYADVCNSSWAEPYDLGEYFLVAHTKNFDPQVLISVFPKCVLDGHTPLKECIPLGSHSKSKEGLLHLCKLIDRNEDLAGPDTSQDESKITDPELMIMDGLVAAGICDSYEEAFNKIEQRREILK